MANPATSLANAYVFLCSENDQGGTVGIAWLSGTCDSTRYGRSSINEYLYNDVVTASVSLFLNTIGNRNKKHLSSAIFSYNTFEFIFRLLPMRLDTTSECIMISQTKAVTNLTLKDRHVPILGDIWIMYPTQLSGQHVVLKTTQNITTQFSPGALLHVRYYL